MVYSFSAASSNITFILLKVHLAGFHPAQQGPALRKHRKDHVAGRLVQPRPLQRQYRVEERQGQHVSLAPQRRHCGPELGALRVPPSNSDATLGQPRSKRKSKP
mmetsp:Transcript_73947/g.175996  ORF Transcript_73947/g.175996 Transcript_73947/m.175996 type:complete len:104 (-) Transcript_73947:905-1216(-)